jgi:hypothetical protein
MERKKVALCLRGAISKASGRLNHPGALYNNSSYVKYEYAYNSIIKHIINTNPEYDIDIFIHCWNTDLQDSLVALYKPVKYMFEDNSKYADEINARCKCPDDFGGISQSITIKKVIELKEQYSIDNNINYDIVILFRPDVLIWKDMIFSKYDLNYLYIDGCGNYGGDIYFLMSSEYASKFKDLYLSLDKGNTHKVHSWIRNYIMNFCKIPARMDDIIPGKDIEILRKVDGRSEILKQYM